MTSEQTDAKDATSLQKQKQELHARASVSVSAPFGSATGSAAHAKGDESENTSSTSGMAKNCAWNAIGRLPTLSMEYVNSHFCYNLDNSH